MLLNKPLTQQLDWSKPSTVDGGRLSDRWPDCKCASGGCNSKHEGWSEYLKAVDEETVTNLWTCPGCGARIYNEVYYVDHHVSVCEGE